MSNCYTSYPLPDYNAGVVLFIIILGYNDDMMHDQMIIRVCALLSCNQKVSDPQPREYVRSLATSPLRTAWGWLYDEYIRRTYKLPYSHRLTWNT